MIELFNDLASRALESVTQGNIGALAAIFFVSSLTEVGVPFPFILDTILFFSGYHTRLLSFEVARIMFVLLLGREVGSTVIYWLSRFLGWSLRSWVERRFPALQSRFDWLIFRLSIHTPLAVAVARLTPGLLTPSSVVSGLIRMRYFYFILGIALSSLIADSAIIILGFLTKRGIRYFGLTISVGHIIVAFIILMAIIGVLRYFLFRHRHR